MIVESVHSPKACLLIYPKPSFGSKSPPVDHVQSLTNMGQNSTPTVSNEYLAKPSGACCLKGTLHEGEAQGTWAEIADVKTYIAKPPLGKANGNILLYFPDVWGMFPNGLLVMDAFAQAGYLTLGLDYFRGVSEACIDTTASFHLTSKKGSSLETSKESSRYPRSELRLRSVEEEAHCVCRHSSTEMGQSRAGRLR